MTAFEQDVVALDAGVPVLLASVSEPDAIRVLLIEDGVIDRGFLTDELSKQGFAVRKIASLTGAPHAARDADVIVLHCDCAKISSIDLLVNLHRQGVKVPVVLLTGEAPPTDECLALDRGAVDSSASRGDRKFWPGALRAWSRPPIPPTNRGSTDP